MNKEFKKLIGSSMAYGLIVGATSSTLEEVMTSELPETAKAVLGLTVVAAGACVSIFAAKLTYEVIDGALPED